MKKLSSILLAGLMAWPMAAQDTAQVSLAAQNVAQDSVVMRNVVTHDGDTKQRKKVALVLSGGGALGASHVGALKVIEETGIPIDMVLGTSIGSIVGAMYSVGYNSDDMATMFRTMDWTELFLDRGNPRHLTLNEREARNTYILERAFYTRSGDPKPGGVIRGDNVESTFAYYLQGYTDSIDFRRDLPRPFACIATDLVTDAPVVLDHGSLVKSVRASMSIPGVFTPVHIGDMVLTDGGTKNNFPADVAREMGADIVIGIKFDLGVGSDRRFRSLMDVMERSTGADINRRSQENEKYCDLLITVPVRGFSSGSFTSGAINKLIERGETAAREKVDSLMLLKSMAGVPANADCTMHLRDINKLKPNEDDERGLIDSHEPNMIQASMGVRYDNEDVASLQVGGRYFMPHKELNLTLRLGLRSMLRLGFDFELRPFRSMGMSYEIWNNIHQEIYSRGHNGDNISYIYQKADLKLFKLDALNFDFEVGLGWEHYHVYNHKWNDESTLIFKPNEYYFNYHARARYNNEDNPYFTRRGVRAEASYEYVTDNFAQWKGSSGISIVSAMCQATLPLSHTTHVRPSVQARFVFKEIPPMFKANMMGGRSYKRFFPQQMPFAGMTHVEFTDNKWFAASLRLQQRITGRHYVLLDGATAFHDDSFEELFKHKPIWGASIAYYYDSSFAGPLGASIGWNSHAHRFNFFISAGFDF